MSGKLGQQTENDFEVIDAGIKIFKKKAKEPEAEATAVSVDVASVL